MTGCWQGNHTIIILKKSKKNKKNYAFSTGNYAFSTVNYAVSNFGIFGSNPTKIQTGEFIVDRVFYLHNPWNHNELTTKDPNCWVVFPALELITDLNPKGELVAFQPA